VRGPALALATTRPHRPGRRPHGRPTPTLTKCPTDTIKVRRDFYKSYTVRLIGIDTPETEKPGTPIECGGREASSNMFRLGFTHSRDRDGDGLRDHKGGKGRRVKVTTDPSQDRRDRYRRLLAYVKSARGSFAGAHLRAGWATVYVFEDPFEQLGRFEAAESSARDSGRGVWGRLPRRVPPAGMTPRDDHETATPRHERAWPAADTCARRARSRAAVTCIGWGIGVR
jgi:micrococcal nuclease